MHEGGLMNRVSCSRELFPSSFYVLLANRSKSCLKRWVWRSLSLATALSSSTTGTQQKKVRMLARWGRWRGNTVKEWRKSSLSVWRWWMKTLQRRGHSLYLHVRHLRIVSLTGGSTVEDTRSHLVSTVMWPAATVHWQNWICVLLHVGMVYTMCCDALFMQISKWTVKLHKVDVRESLRTLNRCCM